MKEYWFVPANDLTEKVNYYMIFDNIETIKEYVCIPLKELKEFSKEHSNIILYKEYVEEEIKDKEALKYLEENFNLVHLEDYLKNFEFLN